MNKDEFVKKIMEQLQCDDKNAVERGVQIVFSILSHRLTKNEAHDVADQLPQDLKRMWNNNVWITNYFLLSGKRLNYRHKVQLITLVENELLRENIPLHAECLTYAVFHTLKEHITVGESEDIIAQLPDEIREVYKAA
jgi:uncharacterized protein (DUF2267 family)